MPARSPELGPALRDAGFRGELLPNEPLARCTTWRIGGPAELLAVPANAEDLVRAVEWASARSVPWRVLGNGSNLLVADAGVRGLVLRLRKVLDRVRFEDTRLLVGAGALLPSLSHQAAAQRLAGLEFAGGIPGTLGGAIRMNAGWHESELGRLVEQVDCFDPDRGVVKLSGDACRFRYRGSRFRDERLVVLAAELALSPDSPDRIEERMRAFAASRKRNQPTDQPSCGSVFLKPEGDFAGRLIDEAGLKGFRVGDVEVSSLHANFFVNTGCATASQVLTLVARVEEEVERRFGVRLVREFELWE